VRSDEKAKERAKVLRYKVKEVRIKGNDVLVVLRSESDSFGITIPYERFLSMSEEEFMSLVDEKAKERAKVLLSLDKELEEGEKKLKKVKSIGWIKNKKVKYKIHYW